MTTQINSPARDTMVLRVDASSETGTGHLMRCLALAQEWVSRDGRAVFFARIEKKELRERVRREGCELVRIEETVSVSEALSLAAAVSRSTRTDSCEDNIPHSRPDAWVVLDGYHFNEDYHKAFKGAGYRVLIIDDKAHLPYYHADIMINQNIHRNRVPYRCDPNTIQLLGLNFALLRKEFQRHRNTVKPIRKRAENLLISCGGVDSRNITHTALCALKSLDRNDFIVRIVVGPENPHLETLQRELRSARFRYQLMQNVNDMPDLIRGADLAITAAGSTCWEIAFMGVPSINIILSDNQERIARELDQAGAARSLGWWNEIDEKVLADAIFELVNSPVFRAEMSRKATHLIDGHGASRVCNTMKLLSGQRQESRLSIRKAGPQDSESLFRLANDPENRRNSFHPDPIAFSEHSAWFSRKVEDRETTAMYVLAHDCVVLAQIRYDKTADDTAEIDISVHPAFRRKGFGNTILKRTIETAMKQLNVRLLRGMVFQKNEPSRRCFLKNRFKEKESTLINNRQCVVYEYRPIPHGRTLH